MTEKRILDWDSKIELTESPKLSLKKETRSKLKSFWKKIAASFERISWKDNPEWLQYMEEWLEEIRRRYF